MAKVLVFCEAHGGEFTPGSLGLLREAKRVAGELGGEADAVVAGGGVDEGAAASLGAHGAGTVYLAEDPALTGLSQPIVDALQGVVEAKGHDVILFASSVVAADVAAALAARLDAGIVVDAVELHAEDGRIVTRRPGLGDSVYAHCTSRGTGVIVTRANTYAAGEANGGSATVEKVEVQVQDWSRAARLVGHEEAERGAVDITQADVARRRRPRARRPRELRALRAPREGPRRRGRSDPRGRRRRLVPVRRPGRPDRQDGGAEAVHRLRHQRRDPAQGGDGRGRDDRGDQQGPERADLRVRRPRRRR